MLQEDRDSMSLEGERNLEQGVLALLTSRLSKQTGVKCRLYGTRGNGLDETRNRTEATSRFETSDRGACVHQDGRDLGFTIELSRTPAILALIRNAVQVCRPDCRTQLKMVRDKIGRLQQLERELTRMVGTCHDGHMKDCYVIRSLANHDLCMTEH